MCTGTRSCAGAHCSSEDQGLRCGDCFHLELGHRLSQHWQSEAISSHPVCVIVNTRRVLQDMGEESSSYRNCCRCSLVLAQTSGQYSHKGNRIQSNHVFSHSVLHQTRGHTTLDAKQQLRRCSFCCTGSPFQAAISSPAPFSVSLRGSSWGGGGFSLFLLPEALCAANRAASRAAFLLDHSLRARVTWRVISVRTSLAPSMG